MANEKALTPETLRARLTAIVERGWKLRARIPAQEDDDDLVIARCIAAWEADLKRIEALETRLQNIVGVAACEGHTPFYSEACDRLLEIGQIALAQEEPQNV